MPKRLSEEIAKTLATGLVPEEIRLRRERCASLVADGRNVRLTSVLSGAEMDALLPAFCEKMQALGVRTLICTDISKDGAMMGTNRELYRELAARFSLQIVASGGVSTLEDVKALADLDLYGAIIGKAYYTGAIDLRRAIEVAK